MSKQAERGIFSQYEPQSLRSDREPWVKEAVSRRIARLQRRKKVATNKDDHVIIFVVSIPQ